MYEYTENKSKALELAHQCLATEYLAADGGEMKTTIRPYYRAYNNPLT
jgi:hypothetical protein